MNIMSIQHSLDRNGLVRAQRGMIGGVCTGLAERHGINVWALRIMFLVTTSLIHVVPLLYLAGWILMPVAGTAPVQGPAGGTYDQPAPADRGTATGTEYPAV